MNAFIHVNCLSTSPPKTFSHLIHSLLVCRGVSCHIRGWETGALFHAGSACYFECTEMQWNPCFFYTTFFSTLSTKHCNHWSIGGSSTVLLRDAGVSPARLVFFQAARYVLDCRILCLSQKIKMRDLVSIPIFLHFHHCAARFKRTITCRLHDVALSQTPTPTSIPTFIRLEPRVIAHTHSILLYGFFKKERGCWH